jgi:serine/threonine-protein kinase
VSRNRLDELFDAALDVPAAQRAAWLDAACGNDVRLRAAVERLLRADARDQGVLESGLGSFADALAGDAVVPESFGVWRVLGPLGAGGMGEVWLAERDDAGFVQRAAIKQVAWPTPALLRRFERERRILARLEHSGIARLIDGGADPSTGPYLAMEYVKGRRIDAWVRAHALDVRATVCLLLQVCDAVQYAHRNLVVHSDLKPSNILVTDDGAPRLLDFGIARALSDERDGTTGTAPRLMTPDYAAPEMLRDGIVTTAVDVYALGVLACELLTGARPRSRDPRATARDGTDATPAPSATLPRDAPDRDSRRRALRGDLDRIVLTAMAADPARRYPSVEAYAADLRCWLDGRAVQARGDGAAYRLRKFVARNRVAAGIAALSALALIIITAVSVEQAVRANRQAARTEAVRSFLADIFARADPTVAAGKPLTAQQLLVQSQQRLADMKDVPTDVRADLMVMLGKFYWNLADYADTEATLHEALGLAAHGGVSNVVQARALVALAILEQDRGNSAQAWDDTERALALVADAPAGEVAADARRAQMRMLIWHDGAEATQALLATRIAEDDARFGRNSLEAIQSRIVRATALRVLSRYHEAEASLIDAAALAKSRLDYGKRSLYALAMNMLGGIRAEHGDYAGAEQALRESRLTVTALWGTDNVRGAIVDSELHALEVQRGHAERMLAALLHDVAVARSLQRERPDLLPGAFQRLGDAYLALGRFADAEAAYRRLPGQGRGTTAASYPPSAIAQHGLALSLEWQGRDADAEDVFRTVLAQRGRPQDPPSRRLAATHAAYGDFLRRRGRVAEALHETREAAELVAAGEDDPLRARVLSSLALAELATGDANAAKTAAARATSIARRVLPAKNWQIAPALCALAQADLATGAADDAQSLAREALDVASPPHPPDDPRARECRTLLARAQSRPSADSSTLRTGRPGHGFAGPESKAMRRSIPNS